MAEKMKQTSHYKHILIVILGCTLLLHIAAFSKSFCDWYTDNLYPYWAEWLGRLTAKLPFVLGEFLILLAAVLVLLALVFLILLPFLRKKQGYRKFTAGYFKTLLMILCGSLLYYSLVWAVPFRGSVLGNGKSDQRTKFSYQEITALMRYVSEQADAAAAEIEIRADGSVDFPTAEMYRPRIEAALQALSEEYPRLNGYYPPVKDALCSEILLRMDIAGVTFPYTMETLHEKYYAQNPLAQPLTDAHELCHHMGYYKESAANFLSELALAGSEDPFLRLSAYKEMHFYLNEDYLSAREEYVKAVCAERGISYPNLDFDTLRSLPKDERKALLNELRRLDAEYGGEYPAPGDRCYEIDDAARGIEQEEYDAAEHPIDEMPAVDNAIGSVGNVGWTAQGAVLQEDTYDGVVLLLLQYFDGKLY